MDKIYTTKIDDIIKAKKFIINLHYNNKAFHFDDSPSDIINGDGSPIFTPSEALNLEERIDELYNYKLNWRSVECPIGYSLMIHKLVGELDVDQDEDWFMGVDLEDELIQINEILYDYVNDDRISRSEFKYVEYLYGLLHKEWRNGKGGKTGKE